MFLLHRVFVEFHRPRPSRTRPVEMVQPVLDAVYIALKRRQSRRPLQLCVDRREKAQGRHDRRWSDKMMLVEEKLQHIQLPKTGYHQIVVTEVRDPRTGLTLRMAAALFLSLSLSLDIAATFNATCTLYVVITYKLHCMFTPSHSHTLTQSHLHPLAVTHPHIQPCTQSSCIYLPYAHSLTQPHPHLPTHTDLGCRSLLGPVFGWSNSRYSEVPHGLHQWQPTFEPPDCPSQEDAWAVLSGQIC